MYVGFNEYTKLKKKIGYAAIVRTYRFRSAVLKRRATTLKGVMNPFLGVLEGDQNELRNEAETSSVSALARARSLNHTD